MNPDEVNKSLRLTANAIQNYSFDKVDKLCDISMPSCDLADEKDSGISQLSADGLGPAGLEEKLALLDLGLETGGRVGTNGRGRGPQAMDDMLYGSSADTANMGKIGNIFYSEIIKTSNMEYNTNTDTGNLTHPRHCSTGLPVPSS